MRALSPVQVSALEGTERVDSRRKAAGQTKGRVQEGHRANERPPVPRSARSRYPRAPARAVRRDPRAFLLPSDFALRLRLPVMMTLLRLAGRATRQVSLDS